MGWLRRDKDLIALVVVWGVLLQALLLSFTSGLHAATLASAPGGGVVLCTAKGAVIGRQLPGQSHQKTDCQLCCSIACRLACGGGCGGMLASAAAIPTPLHADVLIEGPSKDAPAPKSADLHSAQPRAPPVA